MIRTLYSAVARNGSVIELAVPKEIYPFLLHHFRLYVDGKFAKALTPVSSSESHSSNIYTLLSDDFGFVPGHRYEVLTEQNFYIPVDISYLAQTPEFEEKYRYDGTLGAIYSKESTTFRVWAPFATDITLRLRRPDAEGFEAYVMKHDIEKGIFEVTIDGDLDGACYNYEVRNFGASENTTDPYAFSSDANNRHSYVIDPEKVKAIPLNEDKLPAYKSRDEAIIYECSVRDMTSLTDLPDKGTFHALSQEGLKSPDGDPVGLDYLSSLGITHVQLLPVLDFQTVDEDDPSDSYNWGYDPVSFFVPEGSYATDPDDPYSRVLELRTLVSKLHEHGIRVVYDVVYNHVYSDTFNSLAILCPGYFFRKNADGSFSNGSGCGNDFASEHYMARKIILDSLSHMMDFYGADGFRFDLMGILDIQTVSEGYKLCSAKKENLIYYGEGWDIGTALPGDKKASYYNATAMPFASFFNDRFRDIVKGKSNSNELTVPGYLLGDSAYRDGFKHVYLGSSFPIAFAPMFKSPLQSINYVECHDNHTLYDKIVAACPDDSDEEVFKRIKLNIIATLLSCGVPFFHAGEEIGLSKDGQGNSYNTGDEINGFNYGLLHERKELAQYFRDAIAFKKKFVSLCGEEYSDIVHHITFENLPNGALKIIYDLKDCYLYVVFNPSKMSFMIDFEGYVSLIFNDTGLLDDSTFYIHLGIINALSCNVFMERKQQPSNKKGNQTK